MGTAQPSPETGPCPGTWNGFWTPSSTKEKRKHPNIVLQQQVRGLHKEREGRGSNTGPAGAAWVTSRNFQEPGGRSTPQLHFRETQRSSPCSRDHPGWTAGPVHPPPPNTGKCPAPRRESGRTVRQREGGRAGRGCQAPTARPSPGPPVHCVLVERKADCSRTAGPERAVNSLGSLTHVCRLLCQKGTRESPCGAGRFGIGAGRDARTAAARGRSPWALAPGLGNTDRGSGMAMAAGRAPRAPLSWAPRPPFGPRKRQRAWAPWGLGQPQQSRLFRPCLRNPVCR